MGIFFPIHAVSPTARLIFIAVAFALIVFGAFSFADQLSEFSTVRSFLSSYGYLAVLLIALVAGLNAVVPVPAATFVPVFTEAGLEFPFIILMLVIGTTIADMIGYALGRVSRDYVEEKYPRTYLRLRAIHDRNQRWMLPAIAFYAAFVPLPNELILIPLALMGFRLRTILVPLIIGTTINQTLLAYGFGSVFNFLF